MAKATWMWHPVWELQDIYFSARCKSREVQNGGEPQDSGVALNASKCTNVALTVIYIVDLRVTRNAPISINRRTYKHKLNITAAKTLNKSNSKDLGLFMALGGLGPQRMRDRQSQNHRCDGDPGEVIICTLRTRLEVCSSVTMTRTPQGPWE